MVDLQTTNEADVDQSEWLVRLPDGRVRSMTLDELDDAFQRDLVGVDTEVLEDGASEWQRLGDLLGGDDNAAQAEAPHEAAPEVAAHPAPSAGMHQAAYEAGAPSASPYAAATQSYPAANQSPPYAAASQSPYAAASQSPYAAASQAPPYAAASQSPYAAPAQPANPAGYPSVPQSALIPSTAPVSSELEDLDWQGGSPFKKQKGRRGLYVAAALVLIGGAGFAMTRGGSSAQEAAPAAPPPVQTSPTPTPVAAPPEPPKTAQPVPETRLTDEQRRALAQADKKREKVANDKQKQLHEKHQAGSSRSSMKSKPVFTKGGDRYDPLNSKL